MFSQPQVDKQLQAQFVISIALALCLLFGYVFGRLRLIGTDCSTVSAHFASIPVGVVCGRPRRLGRHRSGEQINATGVACYARYSSDQQDPASIEQQVRKCREAADLEHQQIADDLIFFDEAVSGTLSAREGLNRMLAAAREGRFKVIYFYNLSRLARNMILSLTVVTELVEVYGIRIISVTEGVDTARDNWQFNTVFRSLMHQEFIRALQAAVLAGQEDAVLNDRCVGDQCYGITSEPVPGTESRRRNFKPRKRYCIHPIESHWVKQIFIWFVIERRTIEGIVRELNRCNAPLSERWSRCRWTRTRVRGILRNKKCIGIWTWGKFRTIRDPFSGKTSRMLRCPQEIAKWTRSRPHLRLIEDDQFAIAQALLDQLELECKEHRKSNGRLKGSSVKERARQFILHRLIQCECGEYFQTSSKRYLVCKGHSKGTCAFRSRVDRRIAEVRIIEQVINWLNRDPSCAESVHHEALRTFQCDQSAMMATEEVELKRRLAEINARITRLLNALEKDDGNPDIVTRLAERQAERSEVVKQLADVELSMKQVKSPPTLEWVREELAKLPDVLKGDVPVANQRLRDLMGRVVVTAVAIPNRKRSRVIARWQPSVASIVSAIGLPKPDGDSTPTVQIEFSLSEEQPWMTGADRVMQLLDQGLTQIQVAKEMEWPVSRVPKAIDWYVNGTSPTPARPRRKRPWGRNSLQKRIVAEAKLLIEQGLTIKEIAAEFKCHPITVSRALGRTAPRAKTESERTTDSTKPERLASPPSRHNDTNAQPAGGRPDRNTNPPPTTLEIDGGTSQAQ